jgi:hypothetical protein
MPVYFAAPKERTPPLTDFLDSLDGKLRKKLISQFGLLLCVKGLGEPHVKHFTIAKYSLLYELRARSRIMVRIIFTVRRNNDIILLEPFVKRHRRNTVQALESSLRLLGEINTGDCPVKKLEINGTEVYQ